MAGCCAVIQSYAVEQLGQRLSPHDMRQLLKETGVPQGSGGHIGPFPNLRNAIGAINARRRQRAIDLSVSGLGIGQWHPELVQQNKATINELGDGYRIVGLDQADACTITFHSVSGVTSNN